MGKLQSVDVLRVVYVPQSLGRWQTDLCVSGGSRKGCSTSGLVLAVLPCSPQRSAVTILLLSSFFLGKVQHVNLKADAVRLQLIGINRRILVPVMLSKVYPIYQEIIYQDSTPSSRPNVRDLQYVRDVLDSVCASSCILQIYIEHLIISCLFQK